MKLPLLLAVACLSVLAPVQAKPRVPVLNPAPDADNTRAIQTALDAGGEVSIPAGGWRVGTLRIPKATTVVFDPGARLVPIPEKIEEKKLLVVTGDGVRIEGLRHDFAWNGATGSKVPVQRLIYASGVDGLVVSGADVVNSDPRIIVPLEDRKRRGRFFNPDGNPKYTYLGSYNDQRLLMVDDSRDVTLENSRGERLHSMLSAVNSANITVRGCRMVSGNYMTSFQEGGENLRHHDNWSRDVKYQVCWFGGSPDPSRKPEEVPPGSANQVYRDIKRGDPRYNRHTSGAFDVMVRNNYAEYGNTLAWGNKGRQVVIDGNVARFISDYAYGSEGGENIVFSNNVAINCTAGGIVSMYWGEKLLVTGNLLITRHEPWDPEWSWWDTPAKYFGPFVRLHHGPTNPEDRYGAGTVLIEGNLFVSELTERSVAVTIQQGRDVTINGNKFVNGRVDKVEDGSLTVTNNEFVSRLAFEDSIVNVKGRTGTVFIRGNVLRREPPIAQPADAAKKSDEAKVVPGILFTEDENGKAADSGAKSDSPAFVLKPNGAFFAQIQGNFIQGWKDVLSVEAAERFRADTSVFVTGNTADGRIEIPFKGDPAKIVIKQNTALPAGFAP